MTYPARRLKDLLKSELKHIDIVPFCKNIRLNATCGTDQLIERIPMDVEKKTARDIDWSLGFDCPVTRGPCGWHVHPLAG